MNPISDEILEQRLRAEAMDDSPAFSQQLHDRIMRRLDERTPRASQRRMRIWFALPSAVAAMVLLGVGVILYLHRAAPSDHRIQIGVPVATAHPLPSVPLIANPIKQLDEPAVTQWTTDRYAYLDRDGEKLISYMARQLDVAPGTR